MNIPCTGGGGVVFTFTSGDVILTDPVGAGVNRASTPIPIVFPYQNTATYFMVECLGSKLLEGGVIPTMIVDDGVGDTNIMYPVNANTDCFLFMLAPCAGWTYSLDNTTAGVVTTITLTIWAYA